MGIIHYYMNWAFVQKANIINKLKLKQKMLKKMGKI